MGFSFDVTPISHSGFILNSGTEANFPSSVWAFGIRNLGAQEREVPALFFAILDVANEDGNIYLCAGYSS